ncbi:hypothetical protein IHE44_0012687 [Lamprotornis superbus]|uniref:VNX1 n=1 Tax=Lamprotornis superbus TaxID=245042 RepID=A0A835NEY6_9PASS|nr:hypothetical protein IHE44_0012687 [Lamprotornis superbus]
MSTPSCCQQHSEEVCESCVVKTTLTAENAVEANKLSNNYKVGGGTHGCSWRAVMGSTLTCGNVLYLLLFGWWLSLLYVLVAAVMFITIMGAPYGWLCWDLARYFLWPFGKVIQKVEVPKSHQVCEAGVGESSALLRGPTPCRWHPRCWLGTGYWVSPTLDPLPSPWSPQRGGEGAHGHLPSPGLSVLGHCASTAVWLCLGYPVLVLAHGLVCVTAWLLIIFIPVAKLSARATSRVLLLPPERVLIRRLRMTEVPLEGEVILCCYRAANPYYYKYAVDGINVFAVNLLPVVLVTLVLGYVDSPNHLTGSAVKFTLALLSIMPLSYYIGMAIASISAQSNFAVGAVVNATFGSITELTFYITALIKGSREGNRCYAEVVKSALTGTLVGCVLFVPGLCMVIGGIRHQEQRFNSRSAGVSSALLFLSVGGELGTGVSPGLGGPPRVGVFAPTLFSKVYGKLVCGECHNVTQNPLGHYLCHNCHFDLMDNNGTLYYSHVQPLVYTVSILLPAAYLIGLFFTLKTHTHIYDIHISDCHSECPPVSWLQGWLLSLLWSVPHLSALSSVPGHHHSAVVHWSRWRALVILLLSTLCMSACADLATEHISPILTNSTISQVSCLWVSPRTKMYSPGMGTCPGCSWNPKSSVGRDAEMLCTVGQAQADVTSSLQYFIGVTVLAMVPELPEIVNGIQFALQNNLSLSIEIGNCIAVQVCMLQIPILVLFTIFYPTNFTLVFSDLHVYASMFSVVLMNYIFMDGKCDYFQGTVLVMVYFILLAVYFFAPSPSGC